MKKILFISLCMLGLVSLGLLSSCTDLNEDNAVADLSIKVFSPVRVAPGETLTISGTGLDKVSTVTVAGNKSTDIKVVNGNMIYVTVPASASKATGPVIVETDDDKAQAPVEVTIVVPEITACDPGDKADGGSEFTIFGSDLESIVEARFPGDLVVPSTDFLRKSNHQIILLVPAKVPNGMGSVTLKTAGGVELVTKEIEFVKLRTGHYEDIELAIYEGPYEVTYSKPLYIMKEWYTDWQVDMVINVHVRQKNSEKTEIKLLAGDGSEYKLPDPPFNNSIWHTSWTGSKVISFVLTQKLWDDCWADEKLYKGRCFRFSGKNYYVDKVTIAATVWVWDD